MTSLVIWLILATFGVWLIGGVCGLNERTAAAVEVGDE